MGDVDFDGYGGSLSYGGGGGYGGSSGGGGGYNQQRSGGFGANQSAGADRSASDAILPVTIKMIQDSAAERAEEPLTFHGRQIPYLILVGQVTRVLAKETNVVYTLDDSTGTIDVMQWTPDEETALQRERRQSVQESSYVQVFGKVRMMNGTPNVNALFIRPVLDMNVVSHHNLRVTLSFYQLTYGATAFKQGSSIQQQRPKNAYQENTVQTDGGMSSHQRTVYNAFAAVDSDEGLNVNEVADRLKGQLSKSDIMRVAQELVDVGMLYSTISDMHFKCTGSAI